MSDLQITDLEVLRGDFRLSVPALDVPQGKMWGVVGPSGSGKSTLLLAIAGFLDWQRGKLNVGGKSFLGVPPEHRHFGLVFQKAALFPHLSLMDNVAFGLRCQGMKKRAARSEAQEWLSKVGLVELEGRFPHQVSVGQAQRVALVRALAPRPTVLLLDEPFSALDEGNRSAMQQLVKEEVADREMAALLVSHQKEDVQTLCVGSLSLD